MNTTYIIKLDACGCIATREAFNPGNALKQLQAAVNGYIQRLPMKFPAEAGCGIDCFVDEEALLKGMPIVNGLISRVYGDTILGNVVFAKHDADGETLGFTPQECEMLERWLKSKGANIAEEE